MDKVTITLYVAQDSLFPMLEVLKILDGLDVINDYTFQWRNIKWWHEQPLRDYLTMNISVELYLKFRTKYTELKTIK